MKKLLGALCLLCLAGQAYALTLTPTGAEVSVEYTEPDRTAFDDDGLDFPLDDLAKTVIFYDMGSGPVVAKEVPATSLSGGSNISTTVVVPVVGRRKRDVAFWVIAVDIAGNESGKSTVETIRIDRLPPAPPR